MNATETQKTAKLIAENIYGVELRQATRKNDCWPYWGSPLGKTGYWVGNDRSHEYLGRNRDEAMQIWNQAYMIEG